MLKRIKISVYLLLEKRNIPNPNLDLQANLNFDGIVKFYI